MHLTREQMGDITAMTSVHASRTWSRLIAERLIETDDPLVIIRDEPRLVELSGYVNRWRGLDSGWLPEGETQVLPSQRLEVRGRP